MASIDGRLMQLEERVDSIEKKLVAHRDFFDALFAEVRHIREEIKTASTALEVADIEDRVARMERILKFRS